MAIESDNSVPKLIGGFNIPKAVIENKVDVLTFLELMVRKNIVTAQELDDIRAAVVAHLNAAYPDLQLSYNTAGPPIPPPAKPMTAAFQSAPPPQIMPVAGGAPPAKTPLQGVPATEAPISAPMPPGANSTNPSAPMPGGANKPLYVQSAPPKFIK